MDQLPRLGKRELFCLLLFTCNYVGFFFRGFLFLWVLGMSYVILLWHSLSLPYNFLPYMCIAAILVIRLAICQEILISMYLKAYIENSVKNGPVANKKMMF